MRHKLLCTKRTAPRLVMVVTLSYVAILSTRDVEVVRVLTRGVTTAQRTLIHRRDIYSTDLKLSPKPPACTPTHQKHSLLTQGSLLSTPLQLDLLCS